MRLETWRHLGDSVKPIVKYFARQSQLGLEWLRSKSFGAAAIANERVRSLARRRRSVGMLRTDAAAARPRLSDAHVLASPIHASNGRARPLRSGGPDPCDDPDRQREAL